MITANDCPACGKAELVYDDEHSVYYCDACNHELTAEEVAAMRDEVA